MEDLPLFPDLDLEEPTSLDLTDLDMSGLDQINMASASYPSPPQDNASSSFGSFDEAKIGETFLDLKQRYPTILTINVKSGTVGNIDNKRGTNIQTSSLARTRSSKENERSKKRLPEPKMFLNNDDRDTNSDAESVSSSNVPSKRNDGNLSKNALAARENRIKKKKYIEELENNNKHLASENSSLKNRVDKQDNEIENLAEDNLYLRSVLANVSEISALLRNVKNTPGVKLTTSLNAVPSKRKLSFDDHEYCSKKKRRSQPSTSSTDSGTESIKMEDAKVGVCLHVSSGTVSLEFCPRCSDRAASLRQEETGKDSGDDS